MMLKKGLHFASKQFFYLTVIGLIVSLFGFLAVMWLSGEVAKRKDEIAVWASHQVGYPVTLESAGLYWYGLIPKLQIEHVALLQQDGETPVVTAEQVYLRLDIFKTLTTAEPVIAEASIQHAKLTVIKNALGQFTLQGLEPTSQQDEPTAVSDVLNWMTWLKQVNIRDIELNYLEQQNTAFSGLYQLRQAQLSFENSQWQLEADLVLPPQLGSKLLVKSQADIDTDRNITNWQAQVQAGENLQKASRPTNIFVEQHVDGSIEAKADYLSLELLSNIVQQLEHTPEAWKYINTTGDLTHFYLHYSPPVGIEALAFELQDVAMKPWQDYPGVNGLSLSFDWNNNKASARFNSHDMTVTADTWLESAVMIDALTGEVSWTRHNTDDWVFQTDALRVWNSDLSLELNGQVTQQHALLDTNLSLQLNDIVVKNWKAYVPERILPIEFKEWADDAFLDGIIRSGTISLHGDPTAFPFEDEPELGSFALQLQVENARLHYGEGWPDLVAVNGTVSGQGNDLLIESQSGQIAGFAFKQVTAKIDNLIKDHSVLKVDGLLSGTSAAGMAFLKNSPLASRLGSIADWLQVEGKSNIQLALTVPLTDPDDADVKGHVTFANSQLTTKAVDGLKVTAINGLLSFHNDGVDAKDIRATAFGEPVVINVSTDNEKTLIKAEGQASAASINQLWQELLPDFVKGKSAYITEISITEPRMGEFDVAVTVSSQLQGMSIDAPAPVGKIASATMPLRIVIDEGKVQDELRYHITAGDWLNAAVGILDEQVRGQIVVGGATAALTDQHFVISGRLKDVDLQSWFEWLEKQPSAPTTSANSLDRINVFFEQLLLPGDVKMSALAFNATKHSNLWQLDIASPQIKGRVNLPDSLAGNKPIDARFEYLKLKLPETDNAVKQENTSELWPSIDLKIGQLEIDDMRFGQLELKGVRQANRWILESAALNSPVMNTTASGVWIKNGAESSSQLDISTSTNNLKDLLGYYDYQQVIEAKQAHLVSQFSWSGSPLDISRDSIVGTTQLSVGRGRLIDVEPGAAGRIFGLLSVAALPRRLSLDFKDLFGGGLDFSAINGQFNLAGGVARTTDLSLTGDSAHIHMSGSIDVVNKTYDQLVKVTPRVSSALPIAGAVAGGPVGLGVGAAILLVDKLAGTIFNREIVNLITYSYQLNGPWDEPQLQAASIAD